MKILNCIQHQLTPQQLAELSKMGFTEINHLRDVDPELFRQLSNCPGDVGELYNLAEELADHLVGIADKVNPVLLPIGSPAFMALLMRSLMHRIGYSFHLIFAHSERDSVDDVQPDGSVIKRAIFRHVKFLEVYV